MKRSVDKAEIESFLRSHEHIEEPHLFDVGSYCGDWCLTAFVGRGGSGEVYSAKHRSLDLKVAVKVLLRDDETTKDRFRREAQILATNSLPVFPRFYGYGEREGRPYIALELLENCPLPSSDRDVAKYLIEVCKGVSYLHSIGLVHRDIKPQNILRRQDGDRPVLIDLGLVKDVTQPPIHRGKSLSVVNGRAVGLGTPKYAAPEQFAGGDISVAADIHALGMLVNECFDGHAKGCWGRIVRRSTSSVPSQRYPDVGGFISAVKRRHLSLMMLVLIGIVLAIGSFLGRPFQRSKALVAPRQTVDKETVVRAEADDKINRQAQISLTLAQQSNIVIQVLNSLTRELKARNDAVKRGSMQGAQNVSDLEKSSR